MISNSNTVTDSILNYADKYLERVNGNEGDMNILENQPDADQKCACSSADQWNPLQTDSNLLHRQSDSATPISFHQNASSITQTGTLIIPCFY